jgi:DNA-binding transcriptional LysR family regulator
MKLRDVDIHLLLAFDALMRERHVTRAAERLDASQSSMSAWLAKLRDLLHDEVLVRNGSSHAPTELALALWPRVQEAVQAVERVFEPAAPFDPATARDSFRLIVIDYLDFLLMPSVMRVIREQAPGVRIEILQPNPHRFGDMLAAGDLDLAISYFPNAPEYLKSRRLFGDRFVGLCGQHHAALTRELDVPALCALPHVTIEPDASQIYNVQIDAALQPHGCRRDVRMVKPNFLALPYVLATSDLVACVPARLARRMTGMAPVALFDLPLDLPTFDVRMLWHPRTANASAHEWLRGVVVECARVL